MEDNMNPRLRPVELNAVEENGERIFVIDDQQQLSGQSLMISPTGAWLLQYMNGENSIEEIRSAFQEETGEQIPPELLDELIDALDEHYLLENERARKRRQNLVDDFHDSEIRKCTLAGRSIPETSDELNEYMDEIFPEPNDSVDTQNSSGLIVPHIDFFRGKETYANLIPYFESLTNVNRIIMLGISHYTCPVPFALTKKSFETPYGEIGTDSDVVEELNQTLPYTIKDGEIAHRLEHSLEIPLLLLKYVRPELDFDLVPVICSFRNENENQQVLEGFTTKLDELLDTTGTYLIAGVDFAHMGPQFGDAEPLSEEDFSSIEHHDRDMLDAMNESDTESFESHIQADQNRRRVCGYPAIRTILPLFDEGEVIDYDQWQDPQETVSFGSLVMR